MFSFQCLAHPGTHQMVTATLRERRQCIPFFGAKKKVIFLDTLRGPSWDSWCPLRKCPHLRPDSCMSLLNSQVPGSFQCNRGHIAWSFPVPLGQLVVVPKWCSQVTCPLGCEGVIVTLSRGFRAKEAGIVNSHTLGLTNSPPRAPPP